MEDCAGWWNWFRLFWFQQWYLELFILMLSSLSMRFCLGSFLRCAWKKADICTERLLHIWQRMGSQWSVQRPDFYNRLRKLEQAIFCFQLDALWQGSYFLFFICEEKTVISINKIIWKRHQINSNQKKWSGVFFSFPKWQNTVSFEKSDAQFRYNLKNRTIFWYCKEKSLKNIRLELFVWVLIW